MKDRLESRIRGCLMAGAIGDALGYEIEFVDWDDIRRSFGDSGITDLVTHGGKAVISDDTQMTLFTCEGLEKYWRSRESANDRPAGEKASDFIYRAYLCWLRSQGYRAPKSAGQGAEADSELLKIPELNKQRAPGNTCLSALGSGIKGTIEDPINNSKGCGGVMRTAPAGFFPAGEEPLVTGAEAAAVTHGHPGGWVPAGMLSDLIWRILYTPQRPLEDVIRESLDHTVSRWADLPYMSGFEEMLLEAMRVTDRDLPEVDAIHGIGGGWVGDEALAIAVYSVLRHPDDIRKALICAVNHSGDSDSTGAIAGNILGAYLGYEAIPQEWLDKIEIPEVILKEADEMIRVIEQINI